MALTVARPALDDAAAYGDWLIRQLSDDFPPRRTGTPAERAAQEVVAAELESLGVTTAFEPFQFNDNLYAVLALHFGIGTLGTLTAGRRPLLGAALHALAAGSHWMDSTKSTEILRRAFPYRDSQNLVATLPARGERRLRIVYLAHIDAAFTGLLFHPRFIRTFAHKGTTAPYPARSLAVATHAEMAGAAVAALRALLGPRRGRHLRKVELALGIPALISLLLNADVTLRNTTVPGAADNLSGVAGSVLLADRLTRGGHPDVEYVFAVTGAEEAGTGGARRLVAAHRHEWDPTDTVIVGLDGLTNGDLFWAAEGEMAPLPLSGRLEQALEATAAGDDRFRAVRRFRIPVGSTDALPFLYAGYEGTTITCVDLDQGSPRHYHHPSDTADNLDLDMFAVAVDFAEAATGQIVASRLGG